MSRVKASMKAVLEATGIYRITDGSPIDCELAAYEAGFEMVEAELEALLKDIFVVTASEEALTQHELNFRPLKSNSPLELRRRMLLKRYAMQPTDFTQGDLENALEAAGVLGKVFENEGDGDIKGVMVDFARVYGINTAQAVLEVESIMPAHLPLNLNTSLVTWEWLDSLAKSFAELEEYSYTWQEFENAI